jgi:hypothetical protein
LTPTEIRWCSLVESEETFVQESLESLAEWLRVRLPPLSRVQLSPFEPAEKAQLREKMSALVNRSATADNWHKASDKLIFVFCRRDEEFAADARAEHARAVANVNVPADWGIAQRGEYAVVWKPGNRYLIWHEAMHLLGALDCYNSRGTTTCEESRCVMQYAPDHEQCGGSLHLCGGNVERIARNQRQHDRD